MSNARRFPMTISPTTRRLRPRPGRRDLSLIEIMIAIVLLALAMLGIAASFETAKAASSMSRERQAAIAAAQDQLQDLIAIATASTTSYATFRDMGGAPFDVVLSKDTAERVEVTTPGTPAAGALTPAPVATGLWPTSVYYDDNGAAVALSVARGDTSLGGAATDLQHAGYYQVFNQLDLDQVAAGDTDYRRCLVVVIVAWRNAGGLYDRVMVQQVVTDPNF